MQYRSTDVFGHKRKRGKETKAGMKMYVQRNMPESCYDSMR
jgi:hypothetical protein